MRIEQKIVGALLLLVASGGLAAAQTAAPAPAVLQPSNSAVSPRLSDLRPSHVTQMPQEQKVVPAPRPLPPRRGAAGASNAGDKALQQGQGPDVGIKPKTSFGGIGANGYLPPDPNIAVGRTDPVSGVGYIVQVVNSEMAVFNKSGGMVTGPVTLASLWSSLAGTSCASSNAGDPIAQYDAAADRWVITELGSLSAPYSECIAVSQSNDPSGAYYLYSYNFGTNLNDYGKLGVWPTANNSAYLGSYNLFANGSTFVGAQLCAYDRGAMVAGLAKPLALCFTVPNDGGFLPADLDGATPPSDGTPGYFLNFENSTSLRLYQLSPDFTRAIATLTQVAPDLTVASFTQACNGGTCITQPNRQKLDSLGDRLMYRLVYRVFSDHAAMVVNHSVTVGSRVGVRWYELRQQPTGAAFSLYQQGTFSPDSAFRWMGSAAMDSLGNIALGYSASSSTLYPEVVFTGRTSVMALGTMGAETVMQGGSGAQTNYSRWGDYTSLRIDPTDDRTFWYTNEYYTHNSRIFNYLWSTKIGSFKIGL